MTIIFDDAINTVPSEYRPALRIAIAHALTKAGSALVFGDPIAQVIDPVIKTVDELFNDEFPIEGTVNIQSRIQITDTYFGNTKQFAKRNISPINFTGLPEYAKDEAREWLIQTKLDIAEALMNGGSTYNSVYLCHTLPNDYTVKKLMQAAISKSIRASMPDWVIYNETIRGLVSDMGFDAVLLLNHPTIRDALLPHFNKCRDTRTAMPLEHCSTIGATELEKIRTAETFTVKFGNTDQDDSAIVVKTWTTANGDYYYNGVEISHENISTVQRLILRQHILEMVQI